MIKMGQYYKPISMDKQEYLNAHDFDNGLKLTEHSYVGNKLTDAVEDLLAKGEHWYKTRIVWAGDYADKEKGINHNLYHTTHNKAQPAKRSNNRYIINHTKKTYIDKEGIKETEPGWKIHPLPLLTAEGNGRGGGDFQGNDDRVGTWARDIISMENSLEDYSEYARVNGTFKE